MDLPKARVPYTMPIIPPAHSTILKPVYIENEKNTREKLLVEK
jgi:hypothetical protein